MSAHHIEQHFQSRLDAMVEATLGLCEVESPSHDTFALGRCAEAISTLVTERLGVGTQLLHTGGEGRPHLRVDLGDRPDVLLIGHFDTVHPLGTLAHNPPRVLGSHIHGPGSLDMKGGLVAMIEIARYLQTVEDRPNITLFFNSDEEIASMESGPLLRELAKDAKVILVFDFGDSTGALRNEGRGIKNVRFSIHGRGGHAAYPERHNNPLEVLGQVIADASALHNRETGLSVSATRVHGSQKATVVPDTAEVTFDIRVSQTSDFDLVEDFFANYEIEGFTTSTETLFTIAPFVRDENNQAALLATQASAELGWKEQTFFEARGASDANTVSVVNPNVLEGLGGWGDGAHTPGREYLDSASLVHFGTLGAAISSLVLFDRLPG